MPKKKEEPGIGHNSENVNAEHLRSYIERIENVEGEMSALSEDRKSIYAESKSVGFDTKIIRKIIAIRKMDRDKRREEEAILETYLLALGIA